MVDTYILFLTLHLVYFYKFLKIAVLPMKFRCLIFSIEAPVLKALQWRLLSFGQNNLSFGPQSLGFVRCSVKRLTAAFKPASVLGFQPAVFWFQFQSPVTVQALRTSSVDTPGNSGKSEGNSQREFFRRIVRVCVCVLVCICVCVIFVLIFACFPLIICTCKRILFSETTNNKRIPKTNPVLEPVLF